MSRHSEITLSIYQKELSQEKELLTEERKEKL